METESPTIDVYSQNEDVALSTLIDKAEKSVPPDGSERAQMRPFFRSTTFLVLALSILATLLLLGSALVFGNGVSAPSPSVKRRNPHAPASTNGALPAYPTGSVGPPDSSLGVLAPGAVTPTLSLPAGKLPATPARADRAAPANRMAPPKKKVTAKGSPAGGPAKATTTNNRAAAPTVTIEWVDSIYGHASHRCMDVAGGGTVSSTRVQLENCLDYSGQSWSATSDGTLRALGKCLTVAGNSTTNGAAIVLATCNGGTGQHFVLNSSYDLVNVNGIVSKCVDAIDNGTAAGTRLQLWSCAGTSNQKWSRS